MGGTAVFNCSLACTSSPTPVTWYMTFPSNGRTLAVSQYTQVKLINDVDVSRASIDGCSQGGYRVEQLIITRPSAALNLMPVQCSTLCFEGDCACSTVQVFFSKFAVLQINGTDICTWFASFHNSSRASFPPILPLTHPPTVPPLATSAGVSPITPSSVAPCLPPQGTRALHAAWYSSLCS